MKREARYLTAYVRVIAVDQYLAAPGARSGSLGGQLPRRRRTDAHPLCRGPSTGRRNGAQARSCEPLEEDDEIHEDAVVARGRQGDQVLGARRTAANISSVVDCGDPATQRPPRARPRRSASRRRRLPRAP